MLLRTPEGHRCMMRMQATDMYKPLVRVSGMCDTGHRLLFTRTGGVIQHGEFGKNTTFRRDSNCLRMGMVALSRRES